MQLHLVLDNYAHTRVEIRDWLPPTRASTFPLPLAVLSLPMPRELQFAVTHAVPASLDDVWRVLGDFGSEHVWTTTLTSCERDSEAVRVGTIRRCRLPRPLMGRREVDETLTEFEPGRTLAYVMDGQAGPFATASSRWSTAPTASGGTAVTVEGLFTARSRFVAAAVWPGREACAAASDAQGPRRVRFDSFVASNAGT